MSKIEKIGNQCVKSVKSSNMYLEPSQTFLAGFWLLLLWCFWLLLLWCFWLLLFWCFWLLLLWCFWLLLLWCFWLLLLWCLFSNVHFTHWFSWIFLIFISHIDASIVDSKRISTGKCQLGSLSKIQVNRLDNVIHFSKNFWVEKVFI